MGNALWAQAGRAEGGLAPGRAEGTSAPSTLFRVQGYLILLADLACLLGSTPWLRTICSSQQFTMYMVWYHLAIVAVAILLLWQLPYCDCGIYHIAIVTVAV